MSWQFSPGTVVGGFRILDIVGRGGMGVVYRAEHPRLQSDVALKLLAPGFSEDPTFRERFVLEARLASSLNHPNIIPVYDTGEADGHLFLAMRYIEGPSLRDVIASESPLEPARILAFLAQVARALDTAHASGLVHRDVKPENILIGAGGATEFGEHVYLADFGASKNMSTPGLTSTGQMVGTLNYISPEQIQGRPVQGASDQYALGCMLYECLTGLVPFARESDAPILWAHTHDPPPKVTASRADVPRAIDAVVARMMAKAPGERYDSCTDAIAAARAALQPALSDEPERRRRPTQRRQRPKRLALTVLGTLIGLAAGLAGAVLITRPVPTLAAATITTQAVGASHVTALGHLATATQRASGKPLRQVWKPTKPAPTTTTPPTTTVPATTTTVSPTTTYSPPTTTVRPTPPPPPTTIVTVPIP